MKSIPVAQPYIGEEEAKSVYEVVKNGWLSMGKKVKEFESTFAEFVGAKHAIAVNNGTSALHLAIKAVGIQPGDEVLVPNITFISTANAVIYENAKPVIVEVDPRTYNIDLKDAQKKITKKTKAMIPVDMNGMPFDYDEAASFAKANGLSLIADSAESLGAKYRGRKIGSIAPIHIFSFFPNKNITTGEGGMITTENDQQAEFMRQVLNQGQDYRYHHIHLGYNYRMTDVQAAIGLEQIKRVPMLLTEKKRIIGRYNEAFKNREWISPPLVPDYVDHHSWYMYAVSLHPSVNRDGVVETLKKNGVDTRLSFPPIHIQPYYQKTFGYKDQDYPVSLTAWKRLLNLPIYFGLTTADQDYVIDQLFKAIETNRK